MTKIKVNVEELKKAVGVINRVITKAPFDQLTINLDKEALVLIADDLVTRIVAKLSYDGEIEEDILCTINGRLFVDIVKQAQEDIELKLDTFLKIKSGNVDVKLAVQKDRILGKLESDADKTMVVKTQDLVLAMSRTIPFTAKEGDANTMLKSVNLCYIGNNKIAFIGADGFRLARVVVDIEGEQEGLDISIPNKSARLMGIVARLSDENGIELGYGKTFVSLQVGGITVYGRLYGGAYPNFSAMLDGLTSDTTLVSSLTELKTALGLAMTVLSTEIAPIVVLEKADEIELYGTQPHANFRVDLKNSLAENPFKVAFSGKYLLEIVNVLDEERLELALEGQGNGTAIKIKSGDDTDFLLMAARMPSWANKE